MALTYVSGEFRGDSFPYAAGVTALAPGDPLELVGGKVQLASVTGDIFAVADKWYPSDPKSTGTYSSIPNTTNNVLIPDYETIFSIPTSDGSNANIAKIGQYGAFTGASGAIKLDVATISTTGNQFVILNVDGSNAKNYLVRIVAPVL